MVEFDENFGSKTVPGRGQSLYQGNTVRP